MRIRTIKPEFFLHEALFELEKDTGLPVRLAYIGLWCAADREGRFKWEPRKLGIQIMPYDGLNFGQILEALADSECIVRYGQNGEFGFIPSFLKHQCINQREAASKLPDPSTETHVHAHAEKTRVKVACNIPIPIRQLVLERDKKCVRCSSVEDLTIDHIFPRCIGGNHSVTNLRVLCRSCNSARPVQGQGLLDDLFKDGLTLDDMPRICMHVHARGEGKGREGKGTRNKERNDWPGFEDFWQAYPKKVGKSEAQKSWAKLKPNLQTVLDALSWQKNQPNWTKDGGQYIPNPSTYLNQGRYNDEQPDIAAAKKREEEEKIRKMHNSL